MTTTSSTSSSTGVLSALGLGSGLDIDNLVTTLTDAEMSASNNRLSREKDAVDTQVSAVASLKSALASFQASLLAVNTSSKYTTRSVTTSDSSLVTATADNTAAIGTYNVKVNQLAKAHQLLSDTFADGADTVVGDGTLTITLGSDSFNVTIGSSANTLADIRDAINDASDNPGVAANIVYGDNGVAQLLLTSTVTGASNSITVASSGGDGGLAVLDYSSGNTANYTEQQAALDSIITVAGVQHTSSSNTVSGAIDGLTFDLVDADVDTTVSIKVSNNNSNVTQLVKDLVTAYNTMQKSISSLGSYDASSETAGPLMGDPLYNSINRKLSNVLNTPVSGVSSIYNSLASLGVTSDADGQLSVDESKLTKALNADFSSVVKTLQSDNGLLAQFDSMLEEALASDGTIATRDSVLDRRQEKIDEDQDAIDLRTEQVRQRYLNKFNAMDTLLAQLQSTADYIEQQFDALTKDS